jgi:murein DD-endopeptidase MepM/ murein hydrolase activator NlpD
LRIVPVQETVLLNASVGMHRVIGRLRRPTDSRPSRATALQLRTLAATHHAKRVVLSVVAASRLAPSRVVALDAERVGVDRPQRRPLIGRVGPDRAVAMAVAGVLLGASIVSVSAGGPAPATGGTVGDAPPPRIAIGGDPSLDRGNAIIVEGDAANVDRINGAVSVGSVEFGEPTVPVTPLNRAVTIDLAEGDLDTAVEIASVRGPFLEDGTLLKPVAVDTTVADGSGLVKSYTVKSGDTMASIATRHHVTSMTILWANNLKTKEVRVGQVLKIPPVSGLIVTIGPADTLDAVAARYAVDSTDILAANQLEDPNLVIGQVLVIPGAKGKELPKPATRSSAGTRSSSATGRNIRPPSSYIGGSFVWPVVGGDNYISQYYHYGHYGLDIAADYGSRVRAAGAGTVIFAGWKSNGGGFQVWVAHGGGLYTTYNHMSGVSVASGQHLGRGQQVGRVGQSGNATGPHLHFEVWRGPVWDGGSRVNPLGYL